MDLVVNWKAAAASVAVAGTLVCGMVLGMDTLTDQADRGRLYVRAGDAIAQLDVAPERSMAGYDRNLFPHWRDLGGGCDVRDLVLQRASRTQVGCSGPGDWVSAYDGARVTDRADLQIDHLVPLAEAYRSGAHAWNGTARTRFANDAANLVPVTAESNQAKSDSDPAAWLPRQNYRCAYVRRWVNVKVKYGLSADRDEMNALRDTLNECGRLRAQGETA